MNIQAGYGKVIIRIIGKNDVIKTGENSLYIDTTFRKEQHAITCGEVVSVSDQIDESIRTNIEVRVGDIVFFHYLSILNCIRDDKYFMYEEEVYYPVNYESLYCAKRGEQVISLNGYILVRPILKNTEEVVNGVYLPESMMKQERASTGIVAHVGTPLIGAHSLCKHGDEIIFRKSSSVPFQHELHNSFGEKLYRMKNDSILAIVS